MIVSRTPFVEITDKGFIASLKRAGLNKSVRAGKHIDALLRNTTKNVNTVGRKKYNAILTTFRVCANTIGLTMFNYVIFVRRKLIFLTAAVKPFYDLADVEEGFSIVDMDIAPAKSQQ